LNLEIAFASPPFGQNLFVTSFRFKMPMVSLYRIAVPFLGVLALALLMIMYIPALSTVAVEEDIRKARAKAAQFNEAPRDAWMLECVQEDRNNPLPCTKADQDKWGSGKDKDGAGEDPAAKPETPEAAGSAEEPAEKPGQGGIDEDALLKEMMGEGEGEGDDDKAAEGDAAGASGDAGEAPKKAPAGGIDEEELLKEMMK
jgi:hypothetical protein